MIDWNELAIFVKVVQEGSFIGASRSLGVPRSTVSRKVASLEDRLGVRLLHRTTRSVTPTDEGRAYFERCAPLVREADDAARAVSSRQDVPSGALRVTAPALFGQHFLGSIIARFLDRWPDVRVELLLTDRVVNLVEEGLDLAIRAGELSDSNLIARRLAASRTALVAAPAYLERRGSPERLDDLAHHDCIVVGEGSGPHHWRLRTAERELSLPVEGRLVVNALELARQGAVQGLGVARLPAFLVARDVAVGRLVRLLPTEELRGGGLYAVYPSRRHLSATVRAFVEVLVEELSGDLASHVRIPTCAPATSLTIRDEVDPTNGSGGRSPMTPSMASTSDARERTA